MIRITRSVGLALGIAFVLAAGAHASTVLDFEALEVNNNTFIEVGSTYAEDGFLFEQPGTQPFPFTVFGTGASQFPGSTALFNNTVDGLTRLTRQGGGLFNLESIDLAPLNTGTDMPIVKFTGTKFGGGTVMESFQTSGIGFVLETFNFTGFTNLTKVEWEQDFPFHQFDNVVVDTAVIPEPSTLLMGGTALVLIGGAALRRRRRV